MQLKNFIQQSRQRLEPIYGADEAKALIQRLYTEVLEIPGHTHIIDPGYKIEDPALEQLQSAVVRLSGGEPLQYILGWTEFYGLNFRVSPAVLIPRPETELLCRILLEELLPERGLSRPRILDLCTGSGCIAWTLAHQRPDAEVWGVDISTEALSVAKSQEISCKPPHFLQLDVLEETLSIGLFDVIVSNPPYVRNSEKSQMQSNVLDYEPGLALFVSDEDPLIFYRAIAEIAARSLSPKGLGIVEINEALGPETAAVFKDAGLSEIKIRQDLSRRDRYVTFNR